jgi:hypothetical protein
MREVSRSSRPARSQGEGLVDALKPNERRLITYAADLIVQVHARANDSPMRLVRLRAAKGVVTQDRSNAGGAPTRSVTTTATRVR